jgi:hypothetical protein
VEGAEAQTHLTERRALLLRQRLDVLGDGLARQNAQGLHDPERDAARNALQVFGLLDLAQRSQHSVDMPIHKFLQAATQLLARL